MVRIPPSLFGATLKKAGINILKEKYESMVNADLGYIIMIMDTAKVEEIMGRMVAGPRRYFSQQSQFEALTFHEYPNLMIQGVQIVQKIHYESS